MEYPKIETLFARDENFNVTTELKNPVFGIIKKWQVTEKIDGMNIRIMFGDDGKLQLSGRTDNAQLPGDLVKYLYETISLEKMKEMFWKEGQPCRVILYGEGYGGKIQKMGNNYGKDKRFRLFDVLVDKYWLNWENVCKIAESLQIKTAPYLGDFTLDEIREKVKIGIASVVAKEENGCDFVSEGIVGRTVEPLFDKRGNRLILKLKTRDFNGGKP